MLRTFIMGFVLLALSGCASMHDGHERLGMKSSDFHTLKIEEAQNQLKDKTIRVLSRSVNIFYFSTAEKAYVWSEAFKNVLEVDWSIERNNSGDRYLVCFKQYLKSSPSLNSTKTLYLVEFYTTESNDRYVKECGDYSWFAAVSHVSEKSDIFNLASNEKPPVDITTFMGMHKSFAELQKEIADVKSK